MAVISDELTKAARGWLWINTGSRDDEIRQDIGACIEDLQDAGLANVDLENPKVLAAIKLHLRAYFGYEDKSEQYASQYERVKASLALSGRYGGES